MANRRRFLEQLAAGAMLTTLGMQEGKAAPRADSMALPAKSQAPMEEGPEKGGQVLGFKPHALRRGDGRGGWTYHPCEYRFLHRPKGRYLFGYGVAQMDNGEVALIAGWDEGTQWMPVIAFSRDGGGTWSEFQRIAEAKGRPVMFTYLGKGNLMFQTDLVKPIQQYFSSDYGRSWPEQRNLQLASNGEAFNVEGNPLVDRNEQGVAVRIAEVGWNYARGLKWPYDPAIGMIRWSTDGGRTWIDQYAPSEWRWQDEYEGKTYARGVSEGSLVRAANGWVVAALRTDMPACFLGVPHDDSLEGLAVSVSKDNGKTWSPLNRLYDAGRHHPNLLRLPNGDIVMTLIVRVDVEDGKLASYRRGCEVIISHDNGLSWDVAHKYVLDGYEFYDGAKWFNGECGHLYSTLLNDGHILTCYTKYLTKGASLIRWKPV